jgi:NAD-dependent dihydropyrimidine dehydrogenase PreA subunit
LTYVKDILSQVFYCEIKNVSGGYKYMKRKIITINEELCDGCGNCVIACSEGALQIIDGKARLLKEDFCDGFGDCMGECPTGALKIEERESKPFDIEATKEYLLQTKGKEAVWKMEEAQKKHEAKDQKPLPCGCPGSMAQTIRLTKAGVSPKGTLQPQLRNWPVQIHLLPLKAQFYRGADLLVAADCCSYAYAGFHYDFIKDHTLAIGCPKLDNAAAYREKLATILKENDIRSVSVAYMEVPCCAGLVNLVEAAVKDSGKDIPFKKTKIGIQGAIV